MLSITEYRRSPWVFLWPAQRVDVIFFLLYAVHMPKQRHSQRYSASNGLVFQDVGHRYHRQVMWYLTRQGNLILTCHTSKMNCSKLLTNDETPMVLRNARLRINGLSVGTWDDELDPNRLRVNIVELLMPVFRTMRLRGNGRSTRGQWRRQLELE
jgi:hypothetical protein